MNAQDFIDEQFARLELQSQEAERFACLTAEVTRNRDELLRIQGDLKWIGERLAKANDTLMDVKGRAQRISVGLTFAVIVLAVLLGFSISETPAPVAKPTVKTAPPAAAKPVLVIRQITSDVFESGSSKCTLDERPCNRWTPVTGGQGESLGAAVLRMLSGTAPGPVMFVVEGGHDSVGVRNNLRLAMMRAYYARTLLETQLPGNLGYQPIFISTVRSQSLVPRNMDTDRSVTITIVAAAETQERPQ